MSTCRCRECGVELDKETVDAWNIETRAPSKSNCPICLTSKDLKVWRYEK